MNILKVVSDIIAIIALALLINNLGISKIRSGKYLFRAITISAALSIIMMISHIYDFNVIAIFIYPLMFIISFYLLYGKINYSQIYLALIIEFFVTLLSSSLSVCLLRFSFLPYTYVDTISTLLLRIVILLISIFIFNKQKYALIYHIARKIPKHIFILILLSLVCATFLSACNNLPIDNELKQNVTTFLISLVSVFLIVIILSLLINIASKNYYTALNSLLEKQVEAQIAHYEKLEELNRDIRQLRHDYINHLTSIGTLIEHKNYPDALQYIERLTESTHCNETIFSTGNHLADAILTGKSSECKGFADIEFNGIITDRINNMDMCAILANALDNAIEACRKCSGRSKISIAAQNKQGYWVMTMRNPTIGKDSEGLMKTSKEDTQNHGFGLLSIEQAVKRYDGNIKVGIKDGIFEISIVVRD